MKKVIIKQVVKLFSDEETTGTQEIAIDTNDPDGTWISVSHCGDGFSMKVENWEKLIDLWNSAKQMLQDGKA